MEDGSDCRSRLHDETKTRRSVAMIPSGSISEQLKRTEPSARTVRDPENRRARLICHRRRRHGISRLGLRSKVCARQGQHRRGLFDWTARSVLVNANHPIYEPPRSSTTPNARGRKIGAQAQAKSMTYRETQPSRPHYPAGLKQSILTIRPVKLRSACLSNPNRRKRERAEEPDCKSKKRVCAGSRIRSKSGFSSSAFDRAKYRRTSVPVETNRIRNYSGNNDARQNRV